MRTGACAATSLHSHSLDPLWSSPDNRAPLSRYLPTGVRRSNLGQPRMKGITMKTNIKSRVLTMALAASLSAGVAGAAFAQDAFLPAAINSSTIPANGDVNPYGVAFVPHGFPSGGSIAAGDVLIANFNDSDNVQGTGTTIVRLAERGP